MRLFLIKNLSNILLTSILLLGLFLRTCHLSDIPSGFFADEASIGYNAYTLLKSGKDEYGASHPLFFRAFGEFKNPIQIYSTVPFIYIWGLNEFSVRLSSVIFGLLAIIAIYLLSKELLRNYKYKNKIAIISALFLTISPWHIHFSRAPMEGFMPYVLFTIIGLYFFLKSQFNIHFIFLSIASFTLAIYSYFPARIFIPLFCLGIFVIYIKLFLKNKKETILSIFISILLILPLITHSLSPGGFSRWQQVNIFSQPSKQETIFHHVLNNYLSHFSPDFLFLKGDIDMSGQFITRHSVRGMGELYLFQFPFIILGFIFLVKKKIWKPIIILALWLILYPLGSAFTIDKSAQATRSIIGIVPFQILSAIGIFYTFLLFTRFNRAIKYLFALCIISIISVYFLSYVNLYFIRYPLYSSDFWGWQFGARGVIKYFTSQQSKYDELIMAPEFNSPEIFFKFYSPENCIKCKIGTPDTLLNPNLKQLFAVTPEYLINHNQKLIIKKTLYYPNRSVAFQIGEVVQ